MRRLPTIGGQPILPLRFAASVAFGVGMGILAAWWWGLIFFFGIYVVLGIMDSFIQHWKLVHHEETGYWPWEHWPWQ